MVAVTVMYHAGREFDTDYYLSKHMPLVGEILGSQGMSRYEVRRTLATADGSAAPYQVITTLYFESADAVQSALQNPATAQVMDDIPNFYAGQPQILITEVA